MSLETHAILAGHIAPECIVRLLQSEISGHIAVRDMHRPDYKIVEFEQLDGSFIALHVFLNSWAADDYADVFQGQSTLVTVEFSPQNFNVVRALTAAVGGLVRKTSCEPWTELTSALR